MVRAEIERWEMKRQIMMKKRGLEREIYIEDDLTKKERVIQGMIRKVAKEEREKGREVKIGYMKTRIDGRWLKWNEKKGCLEEDGRERGRL